MNKSILMIMAGAVLFAFVVAVVVQSKLSPKTQEAPSTSNEILVTTKKLMTGESLKAEDTRWQAWPDDALYEGVYKRKDYPDDKSLTFYGTPLRRNIEAGEPITTQALIPDAKGGNNFLAAAIGPGMRAVAVPASVEHSVGGFLMPGDHVDIILAYNAQVPAAAQAYSDPVINHFASQTILSNVKILAIDQNSTEDDKQGAAKGAIKTVTVEVTKEGAQIIAMAMPMGQLTLALRRIGEVDAAAVNGSAPLTTDATTIDVLLKLNKIVRASKTDNNSVRVYSGTSITNVPVRGSPDANQ